MKYLLALLCFCPLYAFGQMSEKLNLERPDSRMEEDSNKVLVLRELAFMLVNSDPDTALRLSEEMIRLSEAADFRAGFALALDIQGNIFRSRGDYNQALNAHLLALQILDSLNDIKRYRSVLVNTASDHAYMKNYAQALDFYEKALKLTDESELSRYLTILNNMGNVYSILKQQQKAISVYEEALALIEGDSSNKMLATIYSSLGIAYGESGNQHLAIEYLHKAMRIQLASEDVYHYASSNSTMAEYLISLKRYREAKVHLDTAYDIALRIDAKSIVADVYKNKALLAAGSGMYKESNEWLYKYIALNDSLINEQHIAELAESQVRFNTEKQNRELAQADAKIERQSFWQGILLVALCASALIIVFVYRNVQLRKKLNTSLKNENVMLQKENILAQYETLRSQINPHFLFNSLNTVTSLIRQNPGKALEFTAKFSLLYRKILELKGDSLISLREELELVNSYLFLQKIRFEEQIQVENSIDEKALELLVPPFSLQMLVENAIKHNEVSSRNPLHIEIRSKGNELIISNNINKRKEEESTGTGLKNIIERYRLSHDRLPVFKEAEGRFIVELPLIPAV